MKIKTIQIAGFGKWRNQTFQLSDQFHVFLGENESGKSTIYAFIQAILFGFPSKRSSKRTFEPKTGFDYGGKLILEHETYGSVTVERLKSKHNGKATVFFENGKSGTEEELAELLFPLNPLLFEEVYSFQTEQILGWEKIEGAHLEQLLLSIGLAGSQRMINLSNAYYKEQQELYKPNGRIPVINQKIVAYQALREQIYHKEQEEKSYRTVLLEIQDTEQKIEENSQQEWQITKKAQEVQRQLDHWSFYEEWLELKALPQEDVIEAEQVKTLHKLYQEYQYLQQQEELQVEKISTAGSLADQNPEFLFYFANEEKCRQLLAQQVSITKSVSAKAIYQAQIAEQDKEQQELREEYQWEKEQLQAVFTKQEEQKVYQLLNQEQELAQQQVDLVAKEQELARKIAFTDEQVTILEEKLKQRTMPSWLNAVSKVVGVFSCVLLICSAVFSWPIVFFWLSLILLVSMGGTILFTKKNGSDTQGKKQKEWRESLSQLDWLQAELAEVRTSLTKKKDQQAELQAKTEQISNAYGFSLQERNQGILADRRRYQQLVQEQLLLQEKIRKIEKELKVFWHEAAFLQKWLPLDHYKELELLEKIRKNIQNVEASKKTELKGNNTLEAQRELTNIRTRKRQLQERIQPFLTQNKLERIEEIPYLIEKNQDQSKNRAKNSELEKLLQTIFDLKIPHTYKELQNEQLKMEQLLLTKQQEQLQLHKQLQKVDYQRTKMEKDGELAALYQEEAWLKEELQKDTNRWVSARLGEQLIQDVLKVLSDQRLPALLATTTAYFKILTGNHYEKCFLKEHKLCVQTRNKERFSIPELSKGTTEQLYLAIRLAFVQLHSQDCAFPVIIDDGWVHYDQRRKQALFELLYQFSQNIQVICFSSDQQILAYIKERAGQYTVLQKGWDDEKVKRTDS